MAKIMKKKIWWNEIEGSDVKGYHVYVAKEDVPFNYNLSYVEVPQGATEIIAPDDFPQDTFVEETIYNVFITTVDDAMNESDPLELSGYFDFIPPNAPTEGGIIDFWNG